MKRVGLLLAIVATLGFGTISKAYAASPYTCAGGTIPSGTYSQLTVTAGSNCTIPAGNSVNVQGAVQVSDSATLNVYGILSVSLHVLIGDDSYFYAPAPAQVSIGGNINMADGAHLNLNSSGAAFTDTVNGWIKANGATRVHVSRSIVGGISISGGDITDEGSILLAYNTVQGSVNVIGWGGTWIAIHNNTINGNMNLFNNTVVSGRDIDIYTNTIGNSLACYGNVTDDFDSDGNTAFRLSGQCAP